MAPEAEENQNVTTVDFAVVSQRLAQQLGDQAVQIAMQEALIQQLNAEIEQLRSAIDQAVNQIEKESDKDKGAKK